MSRDFQIADWVAASRISDLFSHPDQSQAFTLMDVACIYALRQNVFDKISGRDIFHDNELAEISKVSHPRRKEEKMVGKMLVKELLKVKLECPSLEDRNIGVLADSQPVKIKMDRLNKDKNLNLDFDSIHASITHSGDYVFAAIGDRRLGIDFESPRTLREGTLKYFLSDEELYNLNEAILSDQSPDYFDENFAGLVYFTQKEAVLKAVGLGIAGGPIKVKLPQFKVGLEFIAEYEGLFFDIITLASPRGIFSMAVERSQA